MAVLRLVDEGGPGGVVAQAGLHQVEPSPTKKRGKGKWPSTTRVYGARQGTPSRVKKAW